MRKPVYAICEKQRRRSACASAVWSAPLLVTAWIVYSTSTCYSRNFNPVASLSCWPGWFESYLVANPEDRFSRVKAHISHTVLLLWSQVKFENIGIPHPLVTANWTPMDTETHFCHHLKLHQMSKWATSWQNQHTDVRPAKTVISLGINPVWSESSLFAQWVAKDPSFLHGDSEDSDQTGRMPRLIWVFAGRTCHFVGFVTRQLRCWILRI